MHRLRSPLSSRALSAALLAPVLLIAVAGAGRLALRCTLTGLVVAPSCCGQTESEAAAGDTSAPDALVAPSCCERLRVDGARLPAVAAARADDHPVALSGLPGALPTGVLLAGDRPSISVSPARVGSPPRSAPASFLLRHSFLI